VIYYNKKGDISLLFLFFIFKLFHKFYWYSKVKLTISFLNILIPIRLVDKYHILINHINWHFSIFIPILFKFISKIIFYTCKRNSSYTSRTRVSICIIICISIIIGWYWCWITRKVKRLTRITIYKINKWNLFNTFVSKIKSPFISMLYSFVVINILKYW
jgi:hypothetical protein